MAATTLLPSGRAGQLVAELGDRARLCDLYGPHGAPIYHDMSLRDTGEVRHLVGLVRPHPGPVLDLAAGSGRITLPLLALGREVTALDLSADMLALLRQQLDRAPAHLRERCTVVQADMADFRLPRRYAVIVLGTTSISLLDRAGRAGLYRCVAEHLADGGRFFLTTLDRGADSPEEEVEITATGASGTAYRLYEHWPAGADVRTITVLPSELPDGPVPVCTGHVRVLPPDRLAAELTQAGFTVQQRRTPLEDAGRHRVTLIEAEIQR